MNDVGGRSVAPVLPIDISDGRLRVGAVTYDLVPLPFKGSHALNLWLQLTNADVLDVARGVAIEAVGEARYVEDLPADLRPKDAG